jgi:hypothetical protein
MSKTHFLTSGLLKDDPAVFRRVLHGMWFALYPRANRVKGSCAFEHVFLGEVKAGQVNGFHNWLFFLLVICIFNFSLFKPMDCSNVVNKSET